MKKSDLDFWQGMAAHYTKFMAALCTVIYRNLQSHSSASHTGYECIGTACGTGQLSFPLSPCVRLWEATDASSNMIAEAKKRSGSSRLHFSVRDASCLPYASETFDAVVIANALHILPEPEKVLREARRVLKPGGWLFAPPLSTPVENWPDCGPGVWSGPAFVSTTPGTPGNSLLIFPPTIFG